jgi:hypothetical protein
MNQTTFTINLFSPLSISFLLPLLHTEVGSIIVAIRDAAISARDVPVDFAQKPKGVGGSILPDACVAMETEQINVFFHSAPFITAEAAKGDKIFSIIY